MKKYDWILHGGRVIDPANDVDGFFDIGINSGHIEVVAENLDVALAGDTYDATGKLVAPGLIDIHTHVYNHATPLSVDADHYCLGRGVTTAVDAGSAGCDTFPGFRAFSVKQSRTRLLAFLHISRAGLSFCSLAGGVDLGELESLKLVNEEDCVNCIEANRDLLVGIKVRLSDTLADKGKNEDEAYRRALATAARTRLPLMVHHSLSVVPLDDCPGAMAKNDIYTHAFHGYRSSIIDPNSRKIHPSVLAAREKGVFFDIGHGMGAFNWTVGEICASESFWPDVISTDIHCFTHEGPAYDMPTVMSKLLHIGMPLEAVIEASTFTPAKAIGWEDRIGTLGVGQEADIAILALEKATMDLEDCHGQTRSIRQRLVAHAVWKSGVPGTITYPIQIPNLEKAKAARLNPLRPVICD